VRRRLTIRTLLTICALALVACGRQATGTSATAGAASSTTGAPSAAPAAATTAARVPSGDWRQFGDNAQATGVGPSDTGITPANVGRLSLRTIRIDGVADSAAIELHGVRAAGGRHDLVAVTTSYGKTIAFDARTGSRLWEFDPAGVNSTPGNPQVTTASPVADPDRGYIYSASPNGVIHKLSVATGRQVWSRSVTFDPVHEKIASALTISGPWVVAVTGGYYGDAPPYDGHVVLLNRSTGRIAHVWNTECSNRHAVIRASSCSVTNTHGDNAIWGRAGAVLEPGSDRILVATGNGPFDGRTSWGDSVLELSADASRLLQSWTPSNQAQLSADDTDLGSSSPAQLPVFHGRHLVIQGGKDGRLHLLDLDRLNGTTGAAGPRTGGELDEISAPGGGEVDPQPAVWSSGGHDYVFATTAAGTAAYELVDPAHPHLTVVWQNGTAGTSPVIAGGLLYVYDPGGSINIRRPLTGALLRTLPAGSGHWNSPIVVGGRIIEPTGNYHTSASSSTVDIYHLPGR
jgi:outer membrane protein assembly factor BamB